MTCNLNSAGTCSAKLVSNLFFEIFLRSVVTENKYPRCAAMTRPQHAVSYLAIAIAPKQIYGTHHTIALWERIVCLPFTTLFLYFFKIFKIFDVFFLSHFEIPSPHSPAMSLVAHAKNAYSGSHYTGPYGRSLSLLLPCAQTPPFKSFSDLVSNWNVFVKSVRFQRKEGGGSLPLHQQLGLLCYDRRSQ